MKHFALAILPRDRQLVRHTHASHFAELFLVNAIGAVIVIRAFLVFTGYPQLGGHGLHIAHMLWGGLLMLCALLLVLFFLDQVRYIAAVVGGIGFGTFIDELGKFITSDNDYFFQPTFALVYAIFLTLFFAMRFGLKRQGLNPREHFANVMELLTAGSARGMSQQDRAEFTAHLEQANVPDHLRRELDALADAMANVQSARPGLYTRVKNRAAKIFDSVVAMRWAKAIIVAMFVARAFDQAWFGVFEVWLDDDPQPLPDKFLGLDFFAWGFIVCVLIETLLVSRGIVSMLRRRRIGLSWFRRAVIVNLLLTQFFVFYFDQLDGVVGLCVNLLLYNAFTQLQLMAQTKSNSV